MREPKKETTYRKDGSANSEHYRIDGKLHRVDGPAYISYNKDGSVIYESYYIDGRFLTKEEHAQMVKEVQEMDLVLKLTDPRAWVRECV